MSPGTNRYSPPLTSTKVGRSNRNGRFDPINGTGGEGSQMSVLGSKRPFLFDLPTFVLVKGGEYLFVPGLNALRGLIAQKF